MIALGIVRFAWVASSPSVVALSNPPIVRKARTRPALNARGPAPWRVSCGRSIQAPPLDIAIAMIVIITASDVTSMMIITSLESFMSLNAVHQAARTTRVVTEAPRSAELGMPEYWEITRQA